MKSKLYKQEHDYGRSVLTGDHLYWAHVVAGRVVHVVLENVNDDLEALEVLDHAKRFIVARLNRKGLRDKIEVISEPLVFSPDAAFRTRTGQRIPLRTPAGSKGRFRSGSTKR